ncbi:hypothetical protein FRC02_002795 [Tulasnella sp. 418]|nr:hypothetical protein FRC02_002795 [Tulasnella sp. 418]
MSYDYRPDIIRVHLILLIHMVKTFVWFHPLIWLSLRYVDPILGKGKKNLREGDPSRRGRKADSDSNRTFTQERKLHVRKEALRDITEMIVLDRLEIWNECPVTKCIRH